MLDFRDGLVAAELVSVGVQEVVVVIRVWNWVMFRVLLVQKMGEDYELEEGEMNCSSDEAVVDLDVDLSYIVSLSCL